MARARLVGRLVTGIGVLHVATTAVFYRAEVADVVRHRVVDAVERADAPADLTLDGAFWFATTGIAAVAYGQMISRYERDVGPVPSSVGWTLVGVTAWGATLMPRSGFWAFLAPAVVALRGAQR